MTEAKLWTQRGFEKQDDWRIGSAQEPADVTGANEKWILPLERFEQLDPEQQQSGQFAVRLSPDDEVARLEPYLNDLDLVAVTFPAFNDGRAYSQASLLRSRYDFNGDIRATGDVLIDQVPLMLRCGIDSFLVSNPTAIKRLEEGRLPGIDAYYQPAAVSAKKAAGYSWRHAS